MGSSTKFLFLALILLAVGFAAYEILGGGLSGTNPAAQLLANAIATAEGYGKPGAVPTVANNPGDITDTGYSGETGPVNSAGVEGFDSFADGEAALLNKLSNILNGSSSTYPLTLTLAQFGAIWSGGDSNWATNVANALGVDPSVTLGEIAGVQS